MEYCLAESDEELQSILHLQRDNLGKNLAPDVAAKEGFLSLEHTLPILRAISGSYRHIVAKQDDHVVGYALVMLKEFKEALPVLDPMFEQIDTLTWQGRLLKEVPYMVMG